MALFGPTGMSNSLVGKHLQASAGKHIAFACINQANTSEYLSSF
jgi:hypothetical protein